MDIITNLFKTLIEFAFSITGDWGIAIVLLTVAVKLIMLPLSLKQKVAMKKQVVFTKEIEAVKNKYKKNKKRQEEELNKLYLKSSKGMLGCIVPFLQLPIISGLYMSIGMLPLETATLLVPWIINIGSVDNTFVIPLIYTAISVLPSVLSSFNIFKTEENKVSLKAIIPMMVFGLIVTIKAPVGIGLYFITSSLLSLIEDIGFKLYSRNRVYS